MFGKHVGMCFLQLINSLALLNASFPWEVCRLNNQVIKLFKAVIDVGGLGAKGIGLNDHLRTVLAEISRILYMDK